MAAADQKKLYVKPIIIRKMRIIQKVARPAPILLWMRRSSRYALFDSSLVGTRSWFRPSFTRAAAPVGFTTLPSTTGASFHSMAASLPLSSSSFQPSDSGAYTNRKSGLRSE